MFRTPLPLAILALVSSSALAQVAPTHADLTYAEIEGHPLMLDLYLPSASAAPTPLVVWIHGGGWSGGLRYPPPSFALQLVSRGVALASVSYRLSGQSGQWGSASVHFPAQIHDVKAAIRWLRAHATTYQIDPDRIGAWGSSAGGHLAALAGTSGNAPGLEGSVGDYSGESSAVQVVVDYYGPTNIVQMQLDITTPPGNTIDHDAPDSPESRLIGFDQPGQGIGVLRANLDNPAPPFPALAALAQQVSPQTWVDAADPPFLIVHGDVDMSVPIAQSVRLQTALEAAGLTPMWRTVAGAGHGGFPNEVHVQAHSFLLDHLLPLFRSGFED
jgi:acetyl esterase/lipase